MDNPDEIVTLNEQSLLRFGDGSSLTDIYKIKIVGKQISKIESLDKVPQLRCLNLNYNKIREIEGVIRIQDLRELHLQHNSIRYIANLDENKFLSELRLSFNEIQKIQNINHLNKLSVLQMDSNRITTVSGIDSLKELRVLSLNQNMVSQLAYLPILPKLQQLHLRDNKLEQINPKTFQSMTGLLILDVSKNRLKNIDFLGAIKSIENFYASENMISKVAVKEPLQNLENLDLSNNQISETVHFDDYFPNLYSINLSNNTIYAICELDFVTNMDNLCEINFLANACCTVQGAMEKFTRKYDFLEMVNGVQIMKSGMRFQTEMADMNEQFGVTGVDFDEQEMTYLEQTDPEVAKYIKDLEKDNQKNNTQTFSQSNGFKNFNSSAVTSSQTLIRPGSAAGRNQLKNPMSIQTKLIDTQEKFQKYMSDYNNQIQQIFGKYEVIRGKQNRPRAKSQAALLDNNNKNKDRIVSATSNQENLRKSEIESPLKHNSSIISNQSESSTASQYKGRSSSSSQTYNDSQVKSINGNSIQVSASLNSTQENKLSNNMKAKPQIPLYNSSAKQNTNLSVADGFGEQGVSNSVNNFSYKTSLNFSRTPKNFEQMESLGKEIAELKGAMENEEFCQSIGQIIQTKNPNLNRPNRSDSMNNKRSPVDNVELSKPPVEELVTQKVFTLPSIKQENQTMNTAQTTGLQSERK